jgi:Tfp pilus assembly protein PilF/predicted porin
MNCYSFHYQQTRYRPLVLLAMLLTFFICSSSALAETAARLYSSQGIVEGRLQTSQKWQILQNGTTLNVGDEIRTGHNSRAGLRFSGGKLVRMRSDSYLKIIPPQGSEQTNRLNLFSGALYLFSRKPTELPVVQTEEVSAAIRGTEMVVTKTDTATTLSVLEGLVSLENQQGELQLSAGESAIVEDNTPPLKVLTIKAKDAVQWALHYPAVITISDFQEFVDQTTGTQRAGLLALLQGIPSEAREYFQGSSWQDTFGRAASEYIADNISQAIQLLNQIDSPKPSVLLFRAALSITTGEIEEVQDLHIRAAALIEKSKPEHQASLKALLLSQQAIIKLTLNHREEAYRLIEKACEIYPRSITAALTRSYIHQSRFEMDEALVWVNKSLELDPTDSNAQARLAELKLGFGDLQASIESGQTAVAANHYSTYAHTVLGFAYLAHGDIDSAKNEFAEALQSDSGSGLPFLGLGLAKINQGNIEDGRIDLEKAVHLEPTRALYRSYLGKSFFEGEDEDLAIKEYMRAIELDPEDPTPYMYRAFTHLSQNRPVNALEDIEDSIERNGNRAVFRSKLMLDQDLAVRGASLAEAFSQLGFSRVAQLEAMKSINRDYSNYSAHRLLADSLTDDFVQDAREAENTLSDMLAPLSFNVFQNLNGFAPLASFNEYTALFNRNQHRTGLTALSASEDDEFTGSVFQTGKVDNFGYFTAYKGIHAGGNESDNNYEKAQQVDLATQYQISPEHRIFLQGRLTEEEDKETMEGFEQDNAILAFGSHHHFDSNHQALFRIEYYKRDLDEYENDVTRLNQQEFLLGGTPQSLESTNLLIDEILEKEYENLRYSAQYIYSQPSFSIIAGGQILDENIEADEDSLILEDATGVRVAGERIISSAEHDGLSYSTYVYGILHPCAMADLSLGLNYTELELSGFDILPPFTGTERSERKLSPKLGLSLYPLPEMIIRTAYFHTLGVSSIADVTSIEPTIVSSFLQAYGDLPGAAAENYGIGIDYKFPKSAYLGVEYLYRDIERDTVDVEETFTIDLDTLVESYSYDSSILEETEHEHLARAYLYKILNDNLTATLDYTYSELESLGAGTNEINKTHRSIAGLNYFHTSQIFSFTQLAWRQQELRIDRAIPNGIEDFWLWDIGLGYRLSNRHGAVRLVVQNILDQDFIYEDLGGRESELTPDINFRLEASLNF